MPERNVKPGKSGNQWARRSRTLSFWFLVFLVPMLIFQVMNPRESAPVELTYTQFTTQLQGNNIQAVTVVEGKRLEGELRSAVTVENKKVERFWTQLPVANSERLIDDLQSHNVVIRGAEQAQNWWALLVGILPWVLIIGFWFFMMRKASCVQTNGPVRFVSTTAFHFSGAVR